LIESICHRKFVGANNGRMPRRHYFTTRGTYFITAATRHRKSLFNSDSKLDLLWDVTFEFLPDDF
jgi:hypothetical protein